MADINVKPKSRTPGWLWIILLIIAIALLYFFLRGTGSNTDKQDSGADSSTSIMNHHNNKWHVIATHDNAYHMPAA